MNRLNHEVYRAAEADLFAEYGVDVQEHIVSMPAPATSIRVLEFGSGEPTIFIHGSPNDAATWIPLAAQLPGLRCLILERPGAGLSDPLERWRDHRVVSTAIVEAVVSHFDAERVNVVASSFGGLYAYNFALAHPDRVRRLIQMGAPTGPTILGLPTMLRLLSMPIPVFILKNALRPDAAKARDMFGEIGHEAAIEAGAIPDVVFEWYSKLLCETDTLQNLVREIRAIASPFGYRRSAKIRDDVLVEMSTPMLHLWGDNDAFASPEQADALSALAPNAQIEHFKSFGHILWYDDPAIIADRVRTFLSAELD